LRIASASGHFVTSKRSMVAVFSTTRHWKRASSRSQSSFLTESRSRSAAGSFSVDALAPSIVVSRIVSTMPVPKRATRALP